MFQTINTTKVGLVETLETLVQSIIIQNFPISNGKVGFRTVSAATVVVGGRGDYLKLVLPWKITCKISPCRHSPGLSIKFIT
jgi:tripartite-type tricarboxylate transporter receptor subunit TctC